MRFSLLIFATALYTFLLLISCSDDDSETREVDNTQESSIEAFQTLIPDPVFEAYLIDNGFDDTLDGSVLTSNLLNVQQIVVDDLDISDLMGIEDCPNLFNLWLQNCNLSELDISRNTQLQFLYFDNNNISSIEVSNLPSLEKLSGRGNGLNAINIVNNSALELLEMSDNNITTISVADNSSLFRLDLFNNPLTCIQVNNQQLAATNLEWTLDNDDSLSLDCN